MYQALYYIYIISKNTVEQKKKIIFQMVNHAVFLLFSLYLYKHVYEILPAMGAKIPFSNAIWSMSLYFVVFWLNLRNIQRGFRDDIKSGNIEIYLLRPISYVWQKVFIQIGQGLVPFILALVLSVSINYFLVGMPEVSMPIYLWVFCLFIIFVFSQILMCLIFILCGLTSFWLEDSEPVYFVISKFMMVFGGAWVPVAFFPKTLQLIAEFSPFGAAVGITYAMYPNFSEHFWVLFLNILFWILVSLFLVGVVSKKASRKLAVNG